IEGPDGAASFTMSVVDEAPVAPVITSVEPQPAFRGQPLTIRGSGMAQTRGVVIGGKAQSITFFDDDEVVVTVHSETPLGAERLFLAASAGSDPVVVNVLAPFPDGDTSDGDTGDDAGGDDVIGGDAGGDVAPPKKGGDDCAAGGG